MAKTWSISLIKKQRAVVLTCSESYLLWLFELPEWYMTNKNQIAPQPLDTDTNVQNFEKWDFDRSEDTEIRKDIVCTFEMNKGTAGRRRKFTGRDREWHRRRIHRRVTGSERRYGDRKWDDQVERQKRQIEDKDESYRQRLKKRLRVFAFRSRHLGGTGL